MNSQISLNTQPLSSSYRVILTPEQLALHQWFEAQREAKNSSRWNLQRRLAWQTSQPCWIENGEIHFSIQHLRPDGIHAVDPDGLTAIENTIGDYLREVAMFQANPSEF
ncbi:hypothetical protein [Deinococcus misasensis]|uniref:hypothetical protein n=1 Tax=Deinococcus misasensis TaxID=392413 RepID=UPI00054D3C8C|nr:hypothetical protein [Deinococcus misasensis]